MVVGSNPTGPITQLAKNTAVTETDKPNTEPEKQNLASSLFSTLENDPDLRLLIERWPETPVAVRKAIVRMADGFDVFKKSITEVLNKFAYRQDDEKNFPFIKA